MTIREHLLRLHLAHRTAAELDAVEDLRMYRNLLALLPYCAPSPPRSWSRSARPPHRRGPP